MKKASREVNLLAEKRIRQFIQARGREVERVAPIITKSAIEEKYKTHFKLFR